MGEVETTVQQVRQAARARRVSQRDLAGLVHVTEGHISRVFSGQRLPSARLLFRLCAAVGLKEGDFE